MANYSIKEVETLSGVKAHTLRIWEQRYDFLKPHRSDTNIRYYTDDQLRLLLNVSTLNRNGMKISKIAELSKEDVGKQVLEMCKNTSDPDDLLDSLIHAMVDFDEQRFEKTLSTAITQLGFEKAFVNLIFPFMIRTGILWSAGSVRVAQEHFISTLIRRKICAAIDSVYVELNASSRKFVLFLPEKETHELLSLFSEYVLRKNNHQVVNVGASMPFEDLRCVVDAFKPSFLVTFITVPISEIPLEQYVQSLSREYQNLSILIGGATGLDNSFKWPSNCIPISNSQDLLQAINKK